ncbi:methyltransferase-like protein 17, mitochondrial isoform X2 [Ceratina calcarata]|uniref:Methyltransferase-like protein 17, mitochondrial isoform X2 n=1 Tax=Ceratina calcarata TaxID=156304 RepID=A0AAJ7J088_9HYME|nr:methyltransferase-like protein 17, mitochondrial isoform X2 [Ceratina calcarata]
MSTRLTFMRYKQMRWYSTKQSMQLIQSVDELITNNELKHKHHPGIRKPREVEQPSWLLNAIKIILHDEKISQNKLNEDSKKLEAHILNRRLPLEKEDIKYKLDLVASKYEQATGESLSDTELDDDPKAMKIFKSVVYNWEPINYDKYTSLTYVIRRSVPEYTVLYKIFSEIANSDKSFIPTTLFDFGSGTGTVMWAASQFWVDSIKEYYCIDVSKHMNNLSEYLIKNATPNINPSYIFYRQFFPASPVPTYDIVVSAYSLFELPNQNARLEMISKLWQKTQHYLVIVEKGTNAGFTIINEARDFVLSQKNKRSVHVFSPCPHDLQCPRYTTDDTPCNFEINYMTLRIGETCKTNKERYSYVVLKKGERPENDINWPRIVRPVLKRSKHVLCRVCTASGELQEHIFTTWKNGKNTYRCARSSEWGDQLPFQPVEIEETEETKDNTKSTEEEIKETREAE